MARDPNRTMTSNFLEDKTRSQKDLKGSDALERDKLIRTQHEIASDITLS